MLELATAPRRALRSALVAAMALGATHASAHQPHDEVLAVALSPDFAQDGVAFLLARRPPAPDPALPLRTTDGGLTWQRLTRGLDHRGEFSSICLSPNFGTDGTVFVTEAPFGDPRADSEGVFVSQDAGDTWTRISDGMPSLTPGLSACAVNAQGEPVIIVAGKFGAVVRSEDLGATWTQLVPSQVTVSAFAVSPTVEQDGIVAAGSSSGGVFVSTDHGVSWSPAGTIPGAGRIHELAFASGGTTLFAATDLAGAHRSDDGGDSFTPVSSGLPAEPITALDVSPGFAQDQTVFIGTETSGVFKSTNAGASWTQHQSGLVESPDAALQTDYRYQDLAVSPSFAADATVFVAMFEGVFRSSNGGVNWLQLDPMPLDLILGLDLSPTYAADSTLAIVKYGSGVTRSFDGGATWSQSTQGIEQPYLYDVKFTPSYPSDQTLFSTTFFHKTVKTEDMGGTWSYQVPGNPFQGTKLALSDVFASDQTVFLGSRRNGVFRTIDGGTSWLQVLADAPARIDSLATSPDFGNDATVFAGRRTLGVSKSTDGGTTWTPANVDLALDSARGPLLRVSPDFATDETLFAATLQGLFRSADGADTWTLVPDHRPGSRLSHRGRRRLSELSAGRHAHRERSWPRAVQEHGYGFELARDRPRARRGPGDPRTRRRLARLRHRRDLVRLREHTPVPIDGRREHLDRLESGLDPPRERLPHGANALLLGLGTGRTAPGSERRAGHVARDFR